MKIRRIVFLFLLLLAVIGCGSKTSEGTLVSKKENRIWTLEVKRAISTGNNDAVDFSDNNNTYYFSAAVFNGAAIAHATPGGFAGKSFPMLIQ